MTMSGNETLALEVVPDEFVVCKLANPSAVRFNAAYCFVAKTPDETSLVCRRADVPASAEKQDGGWRALRVAGRLDFSLVGIISRLSTMLAEQGISLFALSTFDTDYILVRRQLLDQAIAALTAGGCTVKKTKNQPIAP